MLLCLLCSCTREGSDLEVKISSSDKTLIDLASETYDESQLLEIVRFNGSINKLNAQYPVECLRDKEGTYRASYLGNGSVAVILFDKSGNRLLGNIYSALQLRSDFSGLVKGQSLEKVREIDPNGEYSFLYTGRDDTPKVSTHYTRDGYLITIEYDASNTIVSIKEELI
jgi:hypothetical protein